MNPASRRTFLKQATTAAAALASMRISPTGAERPHATAAGTPSLPWYRRTLRWGQTNITEIDPTRYDIAWWRKQWQRTHTQGVIVNAGGIVAYYPSAVPLHRQARLLGGRDLFGELADLFNGAGAIGQAALIGHIND